MSNCEIIVKYPDTKTKVVWLVPKKMANEINSLLEDFVNKQKIPRETRRSKKTDSNNPTMLKGVAS